MHPPHTLTLIHSINIIINSILLSNIPKLPKIHLFLKNQKISILKYTSNLNSPNSTNPLISITSRILYSYSFLPFHPKILPKSVLITLTNKTAHSPGNKPLNYLKYPLQNYPFFNPPP
jgi:hypothetical protein